MLKPDFLNSLNSILLEKKIPKRYEMSTAFDSRVDTALGINFKDTESKISAHDTKIYTNHSSQALLTSYCDYYQILEDCSLNGIQNIADLGSGYSRGSLLSSFLNHKVDVFSYEVDSSRVCAAKKSLENLKTSRDNILCYDLLKSELPRHDAYFIYLPTGELFNNILRGLLSNDQECTLYVIESHGDLEFTMDLYPEVLKSLTSKLETTSQRYNCKILKYKFLPDKLYISKLEIDQLSLKQNLAKWVLKYDQSQVELLISSRVGRTYQMREWKRVMRDPLIINYYGIHCLQLENPPRILSPLEDEIISLKVLHQETSE